MANRTLEITITTHRGRPAVSLAIRDYDSTYYHGPVAVVSSGIVAYFLDLAERAGVTEIRTYDNRQPAPAAARDPWAMFA